MDLVVQSALESDPNESLAPWLAPGETVAFVGSSGVGKSTLINRLLGRSAVKTGGVRTADAKGRHITTRRLLLRTESGVLVIDTPGMREFGMVLGNEAEAGFPVLSKIARGCRYSDCQHRAEPGCAIQEALANDIFTREELESYRSLRDESLRQSARHDAHARHLLHQKHREFAKMLQNTAKMKRGRE